MTTNTDWVGDHRAQLDDAHDRLRRYEDISCRQQNEIAALTARLKDATTILDERTKDWADQMARAEQAEAREVDTRNMREAAVAEVERLRAALLSVPQCQFCDGHIHAADALNRAEQG